MTTTWGQASRQAKLTRALLWAVSLLLALLVCEFVADSGFGLGVDAHAYWAAWRGEMYDAPPATRDAYLYSPAFAQLLWPLAQLPWPVFGTVWAVATLVGLYWLVRVAHWTVAVPLFLLGTHEVLTGNINWLMALVVVLGSRYPALWAFAAFTKITTFLGPVWFLARGEWRRLAVTLVATLAVAAISWTLAPGLWSDWLAFLLEHFSDADDQVGARFLPPLVLRLPLAVILVAWGARRDRSWTLAVGVMLASPVAGLGQIAILLALPRLNRLEQTRTRPVPKP